jgi:2-hydroxychromene-2-carboxylate isomerase
MAVRWYFDFISPFAYLAWPRVRALQARHAIELRPILFAGVLDHLAIKGPAEIPAKRRFTYRHVAWQARRQSTPLVPPPTHPFNPLPALRLCVAAGSTPAAVTAIFDWIWAQGLAADTTEAIAPLASRLGIDDPTVLGSAEVKTTLRDNFDAALAAGVFGVPTLDIDGELFWGNDAIDFAAAVLADPGVLRSPEFLAMDALPIGVTRR